MKLCPTSRPASEFIVDLPLSFAIPDNKKTFFLFVCNFKESGLYFVIFMWGSLYDYYSCRKKDPVPFWKPKYKRSTIEFGIVVDKTLYEKMQVSK